MISNNPDDNAPRRPLAKKRLGQHFLTDKNIIRKIVRAADVRPGDSVLEVGPGMGALTEGLIEAGARVVAIEVDQTLADMLREKFPPESLDVITGDALRISFTALSEKYGVKFKLVSNLPYNISGPILAKFLEERAAFTVMVLMFQKEVAERLTAGPGTKEYGVLSVLSQAFTEVTREFDLPARLFTPRPKVDSTVVRFVVAPSARADIRDEAFFKKVVRSAFGNRRKMLPNALATLGLEKDGVMAALNEASIDPRRRGETLNLNEFSMLANALLARKSPR